MSFTPVGSFIDTQSTGSGVTFSLTPHAIGNLVVVAAAGNGQSADTASALSSTNATWTLVGSHGNSANANCTVAIFIGVTTSTSTATVTATFSPATPTSTEFAAQEFSVTNHAWVFDKSGNVDASSDVGAFPALAATAGAELYFTYAGNLGTAAFGNTAGFTYESLTSFNDCCFCSSYYGTAPSFTDAGAVTGLAVLIREVPPPPPSYRPGRTTQRRAKQRQQLLAGPVMPTPFDVIQVAGPFSAASLTTLNATLPLPTGSQGTSTLVASIQTNGGTLNPLVSGLTLGGVADNWEVAEADSTQSGGFGGGIWYDPGCASGQTAVVVTCGSGSGSGPQIYCTLYEVKGILTFDQGTHTDHGTGTAPAWSSGNITTTQAPEIVFGTAMSNNWVPAVTGQGEWLNTSGSGSSLHATAGFQQLAATATTAYTGQGTSSAAWSAIIASFYAGGATLTVNAGLATATGTAQPPTVAETVFDPTGAVATGTAFEPGLELQAADATGTGTAGQPVITVEPNAGQAAGTGAAQSPVPGFTVFPASAVAAGTAQPPVPVIAPNEVLTTGTGTAQQPVPSLTVQAGLATAAGAAPEPAVALTPQAAAATGVAQAPVPAETVTAALATAAGQAPEPGVALTPSLASAVGVSQAPVPVFTVLAGLATAAGTAQPPVPVVQPNAGLAAGTGAASLPVPVFTVIAQLAIGVGAALQPTVQAGGNVTVNAGLATAAGAALAPVVSETVGPALASGTGSALPPVATVTVLPALAAGAGTAIGPAVALVVPATAAAAAGVALSPSLALSATVQAQLATAVAAALTATTSAPPPGGTVVFTPRPYHSRWRADAAQRWAALPLQARWQPSVVQGRWEASAAPPRWKADMGNFTPIAAISLEDVNVAWTSQLAGTQIDPTNPLLTVKFAFPVSSGDSSAPAEPVTWYTGSWLTGGNRFVAQCLVGPGGGVVTLTADQVYDVWSQILGSPEQPARFVGTLPVY